MHFQFTFKHMESSAALESYATEKFLEKIEKFVTKPIEASVTFSVHKHQHEAHLHLKAGDGFNVDVDHVSEDMYATIDQMAQKLEVQLKKHKEKLKEHKGNRKFNDAADDALQSSDDTSSEGTMDAKDVLKGEALRQKRSK